jgi:hypothetical protein
MINAYILVAKCQGTENSEDLHKDGWTVLKLALGKTLRVLDQSGQWLPKYR